MNLDYSDDESIDEDLHTGSMFVHGRRASERSATSAHPDALFFTLQPESPEREEAPPSPWEAYGLAETEGKRERERERRERRALLDAFPEPPSNCEPPSPESHVHLGMLKHHAIAQWVKEASASVTTVGSSEEGRDRSESPSPLGWGHGTSTTLGGTPPRTRRAEGPRMRYDAYAVPATSSRTLVDSDDVRRGRSQSPKKGSKMGNRDKLLPLVPFDEVNKPFRFERHPYSAAALGAES
ncbi:hypothetical protein EVJ58_g10495 [Rhodofomes roseus]|uniref:Uncharacterized protein n=1 Tax=Rhodofomes roseus TaxID=34475 RepID=A0A4Y9XN98_9APHY|nr:hypothetical protein EVJ58_g10495 [Rhodofomes roseus]